MGVRQRAWSIEPRGGLRRYLSYSPDAVPILRPRPMKYLLPFVFLLVLVPACEDDDDAVRDVELAVEFRADFGGQPLAIQRESYAYPTGEELKVLLFQYYVSDLALLPADGGEPVVLSEIDLLRWRSAGDSATELRTYRVPEGEYVGVQFGLGVKPELNRQDPGNFAADFVLNEAEFWNPNMRYVFAKIEANADLENDGTYDTGLSYHMGSPASYTTLEFRGQPFRVRAGKTPQLTVVADVLRALSDDGQTFDISDPTKQAVHGGNQPVAQDIWTRLGRSFRLVVGQ